MLNDRSSPVWKGTESMSVNQYSPFSILKPSERWVPSQDKDSAYEKLLPPLVHKIRQAVYGWRNDGYQGASDTSKALLKFWFEIEHKIGENAFQFYFAQRESVESVIYLFEVAKAIDKYELMRFDSSERVSTGMFDESWTRYVIKMATGSGKTKVMALTLVWSYFHRLYEEGSSLSKNFLVIAPNIIVLNRLRKDFDDLKMFREEPFIPDNGFFERDWKNDFQLTLHIQDELKPITETGNIFLTNIHRVYWQDEGKMSLDEEYLGKKPKPDADTSKGLDLGKVLRSDKIETLVVLNDEAHHIHDKSLEWYRSIDDIHKKSKLKHDFGLSIQVDFTATPKHDNGAIFVQTIVDYPLVEAIRHQIVKSPVLPDEASRSKLREIESSKFIEQYRDYIHLGYLEWEKQYEELKNVKTPVLFIMTQNTNEANETAAFLETNYPKLSNSVLIIHTKNNGEISESSKRDKDELEELRKAADEIDKDHSKYKAVVSVLMLREGWDVRNVSTIVGLRPYKAESKILPEQTLGRGLRKMFALGVREELVVVGTAAFIEFVESLKTEGIEFDYRPMGGNQKGKTPIILEVDTGNKNKDIESLDIPIPQLTPRVYREYKNLEEINVDELENKKAALRQYKEEQLREIIFRDIDDNISHSTDFADIIPDYRSMVAFFAKNILKDRRLVSGFNILYPKVEQFIRDKLFGKTVNLDDPQILRNLSELDTKDILYQTFRKAIDELTITDKGTAEIKNYILLKDTRPSVVENQPYYIPKKSLFNKITGNQFELEVAMFLDKCEDIISFAKIQVGGYPKIEYQSEDGTIREYFPDFFVKHTENEIYIVETKGREDLDAIRKWKRLKQWCKDVNHLNSERVYNQLYVKQDLWYLRKYEIKDFKQFIQVFKDESSE